MTGKKSRFSAGRRPGVDECIEAWWRLSDSPAGKLLPDRPRGKPGDDMRTCDPFDLYCWRLVCEALARCKTRGIPATRLGQLLAHRQKGGRFADFRLHDLVAIDPEDPRGFRSMPKTITDVERLGLDEGWLARSAYAKFRKVLQTVIDSAEPYVR
jgi:hypothetical protein